MSNNNIERYLRKVTKIIYDSKKRSTVRKELADTIEDFADAYIAQGMSEEEARTAALEQMGDPEETGNLFNQIYRVKYDWKMLLYMLAWFIICHLVLLCICITYGGAKEFLQELNPVLMTAGGMFIIVGLIMSVIEKWMDLPFFYAYANNWNGGFLSNSGMLCGIGTRLLFQNMKNCLFPLSVVIIITMLQRCYMTEKRNQKEQKYLWELATAMEDFDYKGNVLIDEAKVKVQAKKGTKVKSGEQLIVVGMTGFTLVVDKM